jgi:hypothetical protein
MSKTLTLRIVFFIAAMAIPFAATPAFADDCANVPNSDFAIPAPPQSAGGAAAFSGVWSGIWSVEVVQDDRGRANIVPARITHTQRHTATFCTVIHIAVKDAHNASVMYCTSPLPEASIPAACVQHEGTIDGNQLRFNTHYPFVLTLGGAGVLNASYSALSRTRETELHKIK